LAGGASLTAGGRRAVAWVKDDPFGVEFAEIDVDPDRLTARGVAVGTAPLPYRLDYELETRTGFVTARLLVTSRGEGWRRALELRRDTDGAWDVDTEDEGSVDLEPAGGDPTALAAAVDCDLGLSPVTNTTPMLRHGLLGGGGPIELTTAWVAVPALAVHADEQRYRHVTSAADHHVVRFEAVDGTFAADITVDRDGIVVDYPGIARRLAAPLVDSGEWPQPSM
jgi:hypothetical protein